MKFTGNTHDIMDGLNAVTRALLSKPTKQIFEGVHVECDGDTLSLTCSDGTLSVNWTGNVTVQEPGEAIIQGKLFSELMRKQKNDTTTISADSKSATITCGKSRSRLSVIAGEYPEARTVDNATTFSIHAIAFKDLISHIIPAIATDNSRIILTGGLLEVSHDSITAVALDGFRLALKRYQQDTDTPDKIRAVVPRKTLSEISRILPNDDTPVSVSVSTDAIRITVGSTQITSVLLSGEYLDYSRLIPDYFATRVRIKTSDLSDAIDRAGLLAREGKNNLVRLDVHDNTISVSSRSDTGNIDEEIDCVQIGNDISIAFNSAYLSEAVRNVPGDTASLNFNSPTTPATISPIDGNDWIFLVLPVRTF